MLYKAEMDVPVRIRNVITKQDIPVVNMQQH